MKKPITAIMILLLTGIISTGEIAAQERMIEKIIAVGSDERVQLNLKFGEHIVVEGWDNDEVSFQAAVVINSGKLNDALVVDYYDDSNGIRIDTDYDEEKIREGSRSDCPDRRYASYSWHENDNGYVVCSEITYKIKVPRNSSVVLETISANVELAELAGPLDIRSISGFVDLTWPEERGADLSLKTISGEAYSDLADLTFLNRREQAPIVGYLLKGNIGEGGAAVRLESISGDIFLRRKNGKK